MISRYKKVQTGFSMLELMVVVAIIALIGAISVPIYQNYSQNAQATEIILLFDEVRSCMRADLQEGVFQDCSILLARVGGGVDLSGYDAKVEVTFDTLTGPSGSGIGYKPVLEVFASEGDNGSAGLGVAQAAYEELNELGFINKSVITSSLISFTVNLSDRQGPDCLSLSSS